MSVQGLPFHPRRLGLYQVRDVSIDIPFIPQLYHASCWKDTAYFTYCPGYEHHGHMRLQNILSILFLLQHSDADYQLLTGKKNNY